MKNSEITLELIRINSLTLTNNITLLKEILKNIDLKNEEQINTIRYLLDTLKPLRTNQTKLEEKLQIQEEEEKTNDN